MSHEEDNVIAREEEAPIPTATSEAGFREVRGKTSVIAILLGMGAIGASIALGRSFVFFIAFPVFSLLMTAIWKKAPRPWIFLASIAAATPVAVSREQFTCNIVFAIWLAILSPRYLSRLPKWTYALLLMASFGFVTSSINWVSSKSNIIGSVIHEGTFAFNFILAVVYPTAAHLCQDDGKQRF